MTKVGNIISSYGAPFEIAIANAPSSAVLESYSLPANTMIIAAPANESEEDAGTYSMILTDYNGEPTRLTYCIREGNGFYSEDDAISLHIDGETLMTTGSGELKADIEKLASTNIAKRNGKLSIDLSLLPKSTESRLGTVKTDGFTLNSDNGMLSVNTANLDLASSIEHGICIGDGTTVSTSNGAIRIIESGLSRCTESTYGRLKADAVSTYTSDGVISIKHSYFLDDSAIGLVKPDGTTVKSANGVLSIDQNGLKKATFTQAGTVSLGPEFVKNSAGQYSLANATQIGEQISSIQERIDSANSRLDELDSIVSQI